MKKNLPLVLTAAAAALLTAAYILVALNSSAAKTGVLFKPKTGETLSRVEIKNSYGDFTFRMEDGEWLVSDGTNEYYTNDDKMTLLANALLNFRVLRVLEASEEVYGLSAPSAAVSFTTSKGREELVVIGGSCANKSESYASARGVEGVIITDAGSVAQLTGSIDAYRTNEVFVVDMASLRSIEYSKGGQKQLSLAADDSGAWTIVYPFNSGARKLEMDDFISALQGWSIAGYPAGFRADDAGSEEQMTLTDSAGGTQTLRLGAVEGTLRYAQLGGRENTVSLYAADADLSALNAETLIYEAPVYVSVNDVVSVSMNIGGEIFDFEVDSQARTAKMNGAYISYDEFTGIYYRYVLLLADGWDEESTRGQAVAAFETRLADGDELKLVLYERDGDTLFMSYAGNESFYMDMSRLQLLMERIASL